MAISPDGYADSPAAPPEATRPSVKSGWRLVWWAGVWSLASIAGSVVLSFFAGVVIGVTGLQAKIALADRTVLYALFGALGSATVLSWVALNKGATAGRGSVRDGVGDGPISRPKTLGLICLMVAAYVTAVSFGAFTAYPEALRRFVNVDWWLRPATLLLVVLGAPIAEELFFRGWLWTGLRLRWGALATASVTSGLWLTLHLPEGLGKTTLLLPMGIALPLARHFCGSLRAALIVHACNNATGLAVPWIFLWLGWLAWP